MPIKETIVLNKKDGKTPFVTKIGRKYFIEKVRYTGPIKILLDAIKNVKEAKYEDLHKVKHKTKEEHWQVHFDYQWSNGGLILWHSPSDMWQQELTRRGEAYCPKCGSQLKMNYISYCPICKGIKKMKGKSYYCYAEMEDFIEVKYGIELRDYHDYKFSDLLRGKSMFEYNHKLQTKWEEKHFPIINEYRKNPLPDYSLNQKGMDFYNTMEGHQLFEKMHTEYEKAPDGKCKEIPYMDFWHFMLDYFGDVHNDSLHTVNWKDVYDCAKTDWQKEIAQLFVKEFGDKDYEVWISW